MLAEALRIPVATTPFGKGVFDPRHSLSLGPTGRNGSYMANAACRNADVILALGTRFDDRATSAWLPGFTYNIPPSKLIHVDIDATEIGRNFRPEIGIISDAKLFLQQLLAAPPHRKPTGAGMRGSNELPDGESDGRRRPYRLATSDAVPIRPERAVAELRKVVPADGIVLCRCRHPS